MEILLCLVYVIAWLAIGLAVIGLIIRYEGINFSDLKDSDEEDVGSRNFALVGVVLWPIVLLGWFIFWLEEESSDELEIWTWIKKVKIFGGMIDSILRWVFRGFRTLDEYQQKEKEKREKLPTPEASSTTPTNSGEQSP